jgi:GTP diphosphokinase / guanosine-3',5'-bis(diphosphate) 3'-diphosphatase
VANRVGVLAALASDIAGTQTNIDYVSMLESDTEASTIIFDLQVRDRKHLAQVIKSVRKMPDVLKVLRTCA